MRKKLDSNLCEAKSKYFKNFTKNKDLVVQKWINFKLKNLKLMRTNRLIV